MSKYTPGPWSVWTSCSWRRIGSSAGQLVCEPITQRDGHPDLHFRNGGIDGPDARLLVRAPLMFEHIKRLAEDLEDGHWSNTKAALRALVAEVEGESA